MLKKLTKIIVLALATPMLLVGCNGSSNTGGGDDPKPSEPTVIAVESITLNKSSISLDVGASEDLVATILPANATNKSITWSSTNTGVAIVDSNGKVVALTDGTAVIIAKSVQDENKTAFCTVIVGNATTISVEGVSLNKSTSTISVNETDTLIATVTPSNATNKAVTWSSSDASVASVDSNGKVTGIAAGSANITVTTVDGGKTANCSVTVKSSQGGGGGEDEEEYSIKVNASSGITASLSKSKAKTGETITLTLDFEVGYKFKSINATNTTLNPVTVGVEYTFVMGSRPVTINVESSVDGDVILDGEISSVFVEEDAGSGIFIARDVVVPTSKTRYGFNVVVKGTNVKATYLDESRCNADIQSGSGNYQFSIAAGSTYDIYYDSTSNNYKVFAIRTEVNYLPNNASTLESLLKGGRMHSQSANHPSGLTSIHYEKKSIEQTYTYDFNIFNDNTTFGHVVDTTDSSNPKEYYTWKSIDLDNKVYKVVNTWPKSLGNNEASDDIWVIDPYNNGTSYGKPYAGIFDIVDTDTADSEFSRYRMIRERDAVRNMKVGAHYGAELEYEIYESYRGDFTGSAVIGAANAAGSSLNITSSQETGGFKTIVASQLEWNREADSYEDGAHEAIIYSNELHFKTDGSLKSMDYCETYYSQTQWDFSAHKPLSGATGKKTTITVENGYEAAGDPETDSFKAADYFIEEIDKLSLYNSKTGETYDSNVSILNYNDLIQLIPYGNGGETSSIVHDFEFSPSTALDAWQYQVDKVEDTTIVGVNHQNVPIVCGMGETDVTFTNRVKNNGENVSKTIKIRGVAKGTVNGFYVHCYKQGYDSYDPDNGHAEKLKATAGKTMSYYIDASNNTGAPIAYSITFKTKNQYGDYEYKETSEYCNVIQTGQILIMDFDTPASNALTSSKVLTLVLMSNFYKEGFGPTQFELTINPNFGSIIGTEWTMSRASQAGDLDYATISFPSMSADSKGFRTGTIKDIYYEGTQVVATDTFTFQYKTDNNNNIIDVTVTDVDIESNALYDPDYAISTVASDYDLAFGGYTAEGDLMLALSYLTLSYGEDSTDGEYSFILGEGTYTDEYQQEVSGWAQATKVSD